MELFIFFGLALVFSNAQDLLSDEQKKVIIGLDRNQKCCYWASRGYCDSNAAYMRVNCQRSCGTLGCTADVYESCKVEVNAVCGGTWNPVDFLFNKLFDARDSWNRESLKEALANPVPRPLVGETGPVNNELRSKRAGAISDKITNDFPDGVVSVVQEERPYDLRIGAVVIEDKNGERSMCSGTLVNLGTAEVPVIMVLTAAQCLVNYEPASGDCEEFKTLECEAKSDLLQFRLIHRTGDAEEVLEHKDIVGTFFPKGVCYFMCQGDFSKDFAFLEVAAPHFTHTHYFPISEQVSDWAATIDFPIRDCSDQWTTDNGNALPEELAGGGAANCWGNDVFRSPLGFGGAIEAGVEVNGIAFNRQAGQPFSSVGGAWLSDDGHVVGLCSFSAEGSDGVFSPVFDSSDFKQLRSNITVEVEGVDLNELIGAVVDGNVVTAPTPKPAGEDKSTKCCQWAKEGKCDSNPFWMRPNCQKSCGTPGCTVQRALACTVFVDPKCQ